MELTHVTSVYTLLIIIALFAFCYASWQLPRLGVYIISALLPVYLIRPTLFGLPTTLLELGIVILFCAWFLKGKRYRRLRLPFRRSDGHANAIPRPYRLPLTLLLVSAYIGTFIAGSTLPAFGIFRAYFFEPLVFLIVFAYEIQTLDHVRRVIHMLGITVLVIGAVAMFQYMTGYGIDNPLWLAERRVTTLFGYPNAASLLVAPIIGLAFGVLLIPKKSIIETLFSITVIVAGLITVLAAQTTGALGALAVVVCIELLRRPRTQVVALGAITVVLAIALSTPALTDRIATFSSRIQQNALDLESTSLEIRVNQWRETWRLLRDRPLFGAGLTGYQQALIPYHTYDFLEIYLYPHNLFLNFWVEIGLLGLIAVLWILLRAMYDLWRAIQTSISDIRRSFAYGVLYAWVITIVHGLVDVPYFKNDLSVLFMILIGLTFAIRMTDTAEPAGRA